MADYRWESREFPFGPVTVVVAGERIVRVIFGATAKANSAAVSSLYPHASRGGGPVLDEAMSQLDAYFHGRRQTFALPLDDSSLSPFARAVHAELCAVPYGDVISYADLAVRAGSPRAARAVGRVMASNPFPLLVPCHRVVNAGGHIGHYSGGQGQATKVALLAFEADRA